MSEKSIWEHGQRLDVARSLGETAWRILKFFFPAISGTLVVTYLGALAHVHLWELTLIALGSFGVCVWILVGIRLLAPSFAWKWFFWLNDANRRVGSKKWLVTQPTMERRSFANEEIEIDGKSFLNCTFTNVNLYFRGRAPFVITNCQVSGTLKVKTDFLPIRAHLDLIEWTKTLPGWSGTVLVHEHPLTGQQWEVSRQLPIPPQHRPRFKPPKSKKNR